MTYTIEYTVDDDIQMDTTPFSTESYTIIDLMKGTNYSVRVSLSNSAGNGVYSSPEIGRTAVDRECLNVACSHGRCICLLVLICFFPLAL